MFGKCRGTFFLAGLIFAVAFLVVSPTSLSSEESSTGNLVGFIYETDGTTPLEGAVVKIKDVSTGSYYESSQSDTYGVFKIAGLKSGIYMIGVTTSAGDFASNDLIGISESETAKLSLSLTPYDAQTQAAVRELYEDQKEAKTSRVGRVVNYLPDTGEAEVFIERGLLQVGDHIRVKGDKTNFTMKVKSLMIEGQPIDKALSGQTCIFSLTHTSIAGDSVFLISKRGIIPFLVTPCGLLTLAATTTGITIITTTEEEPKSPFKK